MSSTRSADIAAIRSNINDVKGLIEKLNASLNDAKSAILAARAEVEVETKSLKERETNLSKELSEIQAKLGARESEMATLQKQLEEAASKSTVEIDEMRASLDAKNNEILDMESEIAAIQSLTGQLKVEVNEMVAPAGSVTAGGARRSRKLARLLQRQQKRSRQFGRKIRRSRK
jgi:chromosome segregation ATPase